MFTGRPQRFRLERQPVDESSPERGEVVLNVNSYNCGALPSRVPIRKMEHISIQQKMKSLLLDTST